MIALDTDVVAELVRPRPDQGVIDWVDRQNSTELVITALTAAEIRTGVALLPEGSRKRKIGVLMETLITDTFAGYVLPFDVDSSSYYAEILQTRTRSGRPISAFDAQIAAICRQHQALLATRNTADFADIGLSLINPWQSTQ